MTPMTSAPTSGAGEGGDERRPTPSTASSAGLGPAAGARRRRAARARRRARAAGSRRARWTCVLGCRVRGGRYVLRHEQPVERRDDAHAGGRLRAVAGDEHRLAGPPRARRRRRPRRCRRRAAPRRPRPPSRSSAARKIAGSGLATPSSAEMTTRVDERRAARCARARRAARRPSCRRRPGARRRARSAREHGGHLGEGAEAHRRQQRRPRRRPAAARCRSDSCTTPAQRRRRSFERRPVARLVVVGAVVGDLGPHRRARVLAVDHRRRARRARAPGAATGASSSTSVPRASSRTAEGIPVTRHDGPHRRSRLVVGPLDRRRR